MKKSLTLLLFVLSACNNEPSKWSLSMYETKDIATYRSTVIMPNRDTEHSMLIDGREQKVIFTNGKVHIK